MKKNWPLIFPNYVETKVYTKSRLLERAIPGNAMEMKVKYVFGDIAEME